MENADIFTPAEAAQVLTALGVRRTAATLANERVLCNTGLLVLLNLTYEGAHQDHSRTRPGKFPHIEEPQIVGAAVY